MQGVGSSAIRDRLAIMLSCMKNLPNIITSVRLIAAVVLIVECMLGQAVPHFLALFIAAGVSDMLDGFIARRFNWCTDFGARLDSISDLSLYVSVFIFLSLNCGADVGKCVPVLICGAAAQVAHLILSYRKFQQFPAYHSTFTRCMAYLMFFGLIAYWTTRNATILPALAIFWVLCSLEGMIITAILKRPTINVSSILTALRIESRTQSHIHPHLIADTISRTIDASAIR